MPAKTNNASIRLMIREELKPINEFVVEQRVFNQKIGQTVYGSNGEGGISHVLRAQGEKIDEIEKNQSEGVGRRTVYSVLGGGAAGAVIAWASKLFK